MNFVQKFKVAYPIAYDPDLTVANKYLQGGYPTIVVIGRDGKIAAVRDGEISQQQTPTGPRQNVEVLAGRAGGRRSRGRR